MIHVLGDNKEVIKLSNKNYNKMSQKPDKEFEIVVEASEVTEEQKPVEFKPILGAVTDCAKLNVRAKPSLKADVVLVIDNGVKVYIDKKKSTKEFYCVCSDDGDTIGFCMKKYITIEQ